MSETTEIFQASNGWKVETGPHHLIRAIYNLDGRDSLDDVLVREEVVAIVEFAGTVGIHAPNAESPRQVTYHLAGNEVAAAEWEEFMAWKAERKAEAIAKRTEQAISTFVYRDKVAPAWDDVRDELRNIVRMAKAGEIDLGEAEEKSE